MLPVKVDNAACLNGKWRGMVKALEGGTYVNRNTTTGASGIDADRFVARVAVQPRLGLLSEWWIRCNRSNSPDSRAHRHDLKRRLSRDRFMSIRPLFQRVCAKRPREAVAVSFGPYSLPCFSS